MIFLDASVLLAAEDTDDSHHTSCVAVLRTGALATVDLALYETVNVAETCWHDTTAATRLSDRIWAIAELGALVRVDRTLAEQITVLSAQHALSAYDAAYVAGHSTSVFPWPAATSATSSPVASRTSPVICSQAEQTTTPVADCLVGAAFRGCRCAGSRSTAGRARVYRDT